MIPLLTTVVLGLLLSTTTASYYPPIMPYLVPAAAYIPPYPAYHHAAAAAAAPVDYGYPEQKQPKQDAKYYYGGKFQGSCSNDGLYYRDETAFVICSNGYPSDMACPPGTKTAEFPSYQAGYYYGYTDLCSVNLVDFGYGPDSYSASQPAAAPGYRKDSLSYKDKTYGSSSSSSSYGDKDDYNSYPAAPSRDSYATPKNTGYTSPADSYPAKQNSYTPSKPASSYPSYPQKNSYPSKTPDYVPKDSFNKDSYNKDVYRKVPSYNQKDIFSKEAYSGPRDSSRAAYQAAQKYPSTKPSYSFSNDYQPKADKPSYSSSNPAYVPRDTAAYSNKDAGYSGSGTANNAYQPYDPAAYPAAASRDHAKLTGYSAGDDSYAAAKVTYPAKVKYSAAAGGDDAPKNY